MAPFNDRSPRAGGVLLMLAIFVGAGIGFATGQSTLGLLGGVAVGALLALTIWLADRRRDRF